MEEKRGTDHAPAFGGISLVCTHEVALLRHIQLAAGIEQFVGDGLARTGLVALLHRPALGL